MCFGVQCNLEYLIESHIPLVFYHGLVSYLIIGKVNCKESWGCMLNATQNLHFQVYGKRSIQVINKGYGEVKCDFFFWRSMVWTRNWAKQLYRIWCCWMI
jgi:hypothetical protein